MARKSRPAISRALLLGAKVLAAMALLSWVVLVGRVMREPASHCPKGFVSTGARCCVPGQTLSASGLCEGSPTVCPAGTQLIGQELQSCALPARKVRIEGGELKIGPSDWDTQGITEQRTLTVVPFLIDNLEVTVWQYRECVEAGVCAARSQPEEPGLPVTGVDAHQAEAYCAFAGGHLPSAAQWTIAAMGTEGRRFPWGEHGLVCRRAVFGMVDGPCAQGAQGPEVGGMRPDGRSPDGLYDLSGNVSEWTIDEDGTPIAKGGSFRSKLAADLKNLGRSPAGPAADVGFRCAYPILGIEDALSAQPMDTQQAN